MEKRRWLLVIYIAMFATGMLVNWPHKTNLESNNPAHSEFTPTLVEAYQELKKNETITGREYLGLNEMVQEKEQTQLKELAALINESTQEILSFMMDTEGVLVVRQKAWDGNSEHHL